MSDTPDPMNAPAPAPHPGLHFLNDAVHSAATNMLKRCCGSSRWVRAMVAARPFSSVDELRATARRIDDTLTRNDWLESFSHHPRIGDRAVLRARAAGWAGGEQGGVDAADDELLDALAEANREYERTFGFLFLICATGLTGRDMLAAVRERIASGTRDDEWKIAANEQRKITQLRLSKLIEEHTAS